uniref:Uncharacterized protein n=1 Tax=Hemiselmis tepida TaxID=464990 RepID=A0A7S0YY02_9CRYP|mmetsp:Transcript_21925/g.55402  ORF Transcript_21925/g.55402 Transcript_21925/m.55402 type:complete len:192 (+) Transcript_21925:1239-1814(+)
MCFIHVWKRPRCAIARGRLTQHEVDGADEMSVPIAYKMFGPWSIRNRPDLYDNVSFRRFNNDPLECYFSKMGHETVKGWCIHYSATCDETEKQVLAAEGKLGYKLPTPPNTALSANLIFKRLSMEKLEKLRGAGADVATLMMSTPQGSQEWHGYRNARICQEALRVRASARGRRGSDRDPDAAETTRQHPL